MQEWQRRFWTTAVSGYVGVVTRMVLGLILFKTMFHQFSSAQFGFWTLLWSLFGYGILLDFGFGFTAQKAVAEKTAIGDTKGLSGLLATILWTYLGIAAGILVVFLSIRGWFLGRMHVAPQDWEEFGRAYTVFFAGLAVMFPLGLFPEILRGLQRVDLANWVNTLTTVVNFVVLFAGLKLGWPLPWLMSVGVVTSILPNTFAAVMAVRRLPGVSFSPRLFRWQSVRAQMGFSMTAYLITFSNMLMSKTDQAVISLVLGVDSVKIYQAGFKMGEMLNLFGGQLQKALSPAAAAMHSLGDENGLKVMMMRSSRMTFLLVTPCYLLSAVYLEPLIRLLTGEAPQLATWWIGQVLLFAIYSSMLTNSCSKQILVMCGEERRLLRLSLVEGLANLVLSIVLARRMGVLGVAVGTMLPTALIGWCWVLPVTLRRLALPAWEFVAYHLRGTPLPLLVFGVLLAGLKWLVPAAPDSGFVALGWRGALCMLPLLYLSRSVLRGISHTAADA